MSTTTSNMGLTLPTVGVEPGPDWASELNSSLSTVDSHNHSPGQGVPITPDGLSISSDLSFLSNNALSLRSMRFTPQLSPLALGSDLGCLYEAGVDLYYNDGNGNQIRLTQSGSIAGASGNITNLTSPASVTYVSGTPAFVFQSDTSTAANLDAGALTIRKLTASSPGIKLTAPSGLSGSYSLTLPAAPPASRSPLQMDSSGNVSTGGDLAVGFAGVVIPESLTAPSTAILPYGLQPGGSTFAKLVAQTLNTIGIADNVGATIRQIVVSANPSTAGLMIVRGNISWSGTAWVIDQGEGFSVSEPSTHVCRITFTAPFTDPPAITTTGIGQVAIINTYPLSTINTVDLQTINFGTGVPNYGPFSFICIGQRG